MNEQIENRLFEAWLRRSWGPSALGGDYLAWDKMGNCYVHTETQVGWEAWLAAKRSRQALNVSEVKP